MSKQDSLFDSPTDKTLEALSVSVRRSFQACLGPPRLSAAALAQRIATFVTKTEEAAAVKEFVDLETARTAAGICSGLVAGLSDPTDDETRALVQATVLYLVLESDGDHDIDSPIGFDDDLEVAEAVARAIGRADLIEDR